MIAPETHPPEVYPSNRELRLRLDAAIARRIREKQCEERVKPPESIRELTLVPRG